jgi:hypothetical protein
LLPPPAFVIARYCATVNALDAGPFAANCQPLSFGGLNISHCLPLLLLLLVDWCLVVYHPILSLHAIERPLMLLSWVIFAENLCQLLMPPLLPPPPLPPGNHRCYHHHHCRTHRHPFLKKEATAALPNGSTKVKTFTRSPDNLVLFNLSTVFEVYDVGWLREFSN